MKKDDRFLLEEHLEVLKDLQEVHTDPFFYTRLRARMDAGKGMPAWDLPLRPAWVIGPLMLLLAVNLIWLNQKETGSQPTTVVSISDFAASYDQTIDTPY